MHRVVLPIVLMAGFLGGCFGPDEPPDELFVPNEQKPKKALNWNELVAEAEKTLAKNNQSVMETYNLRQADGFEFNFETGTLAFTKQKTPMVVADIQVVGTHATSDNTFLWAWSNKTVPDKSTAQVTAVADYGRNNGIPKLTEPEITATPEEVDQLVAVASQVLSATGSYKVPSEGSTLHLLYMKLRWAEGFGPKQPR